MILSLDMKGQVGIGTVTPDPSSVLDLSSSDKGLLIPRVNLSSINDTSVIPVTVADQGILIYNLTDAGTAPDNVRKDTFYIWTGTKWEGIGEISDIRQEIADNNTTQLVFSGMSPVAAYQYGPANSYLPWTNVNFSTENYDNQNIHTGGVFTIPETGLYSITGCVNISLAQTGGTSKSIGSRIFNITDNTVLATSYFGTSGGGNSGTNPIYWMGNLTAGTQIRIQARMIDTLVNVMTVNTSTSMAIRKHF
ncbi:hypothetical protein [Chryseobacterium indologenes]|uniref:C1q domain-containing protein n=1 Tax=Chryseobacterium indologenes TaxID=253 RepID=A0A0N0IW94_CHRID|nr:hypothetical protein [Chryseobacterium indologenes]KPE51203.1 hypothetical protein AOB46_11080 [Chryseobacterium indologenes]